jgi:hypothetical protein
LQDWLAKIPVPKLVLPDWTGHLRYAVLVGLVIVLPMVLGLGGTPFEDQAVSICRFCPAGALEAGLPYSIRSHLSGDGWLMSWHKSTILAVFLAASVFIYRPWCRLLCPLGGLLALGNRFSLFHLRFKATECAECNLCRTHCPAGVKVDQAVNVTGCIRCLECTKCGALTPAFSRPSDGEPSTGKRLS